MTKARSNATAPNAKGTLVVGNGTDASTTLAVASTAGYVLTVDSSTSTGLKWAAAGASDQNWSLVNTGGTDLSGTSTTTISGISGANGLFVLMDTLNTSSNYELYLRFNSDTGNNYANAGGLYLSGSTYAASNVQRLGANISASYILVGGFSTNTGSNLQAGLMLWGCNTAGVKIGSLSSGSTAAGGDSNYLVTEHIAYFGTSAISSVTVYLSGGTFDSGSTNKVYIYKTA